MSTGARVGELVMVAPTALVATTSKSATWRSSHPDVAWAVARGSGAALSSGWGLPVVPQRTVGDDAVVKAGAVVAADVAPGTRVAGGPARPREAPT